MESILLLFKIILMESKILHVAIIDDDDDMLTFFRKTTFETQNIICLATANSVEEFAKNFRQLKQRLVIFLDIFLESKLSITDIPYLLKIFPHAEIIIYSISEDYNHIINAVTLGAKGYIIKDKNQDKLKQHFEIVRLGGAVISPIMASKLINFLQAKTETQLEVKLSKKDHELLTLLSEGWSYARIAEQIGITLDGVRGRIKSLYSKLNVSSKIEAINKIRNL